MDLKMDTDPMAVDLENFGARLKEIVANQVRELELRGPRPRVFNPNSATYWLPKLLEIPDLIAHIPESIIIPYDHSALIGFMKDGQGYNWQDLLTRANEAALQIGYPVFLRTDLSSDKHGGYRSFLVERAQDFPETISRTAEDNEMKFWTTQVPEAFLLRKYLHLNYEFMAFYGLPIAREFRLFATKDSIICAHPYWPEEAIQFFGEVREPLDWKNHLNKLHQKPSENIWSNLEEFAKMAVGQCDVHEAWSVDFAEDINGKWWLIDIAIAEQSYHWPGCLELKKE
jgi:hypothetical protein